MAALHISISAEKVAQIGPLIISNSMLTSMVVTALIFLLCYGGYSVLQKKGKLGRFQMFIELIIESLFKLCVDITGTSKKAKEFAPIIISFFLFIILNNWLGLLPGVGTIGFREKAEHEQTSVAQTTLLAVNPKVATDTKAVEPTAAPHEEGAANGTAKEVTETHAAETKGIFIPYFRAGTADLNTTLALALISVILTQYYGFAHLKAGYLKKYINFGSPIMFFVGLLETVLEFAKIMSFAFRLFGNIFAGEVLLAVMMFLVPVIIPMPFYGLELFVGFIQALVFSMLSLVFFNLATMGHEEDH